jgi:hypothetical protein
LTVRVARDRYMHVMGVCKGVSAYYIESERAGAWRNGPLSHAKTGFSSPVQISRYRQPFVYTSLEAPTMFTPSASSITEKFRSSQRSQPHPSSPLLEAGCFCHADAHRRISLVRVWSRRSFLLCHHRPPFLSLSLMKVRKLRSAMRNKINPTAP